MVCIREKKAPALWVGLAVSVVAHLLSLTRTISLSGLNVNPGVPLIEDIFEIVDVPALPVDPAAGRKKIIVQTEDAGNREEDADASFISDRTQKARKESRAKTIGEFKAGEKSEREAAALLSKPIDSNFPPEVSPEGEGAVAPLKRLETLSLRDLSVSGKDFASNDSVSRDVAAGNRTVLSTKEYRYFSYYQRIRDLLRLHWSPRVQHTMARLWQSGRSLRANEWTTQLHILLDASGRIQKIAKVVTCGIDEIDAAAVEAFKLAGPFPNPPRALLDSDGFARINWSFVLTTETAPQVQFSARGYGPQ